MPTNPDIILQQLQKMDAKIDGLANEIHKTNISITKLEGMKHALQDLKNWKINVENAVNPEDLREMKGALSQIIQYTEDVNNMEKEIESLKEEKEKDKIEIDKLKTFKTQVVTYGTIASFLFAVALTVLGWYLS